MGFPVGYAEAFMPRVFFHVLSLMGFMRSLVTTILTSLGLSDFLESDLSSSVQSWPSDPIRYSTSRSATLIRELLPVVKFEELKEAGDHSVEGCAVCLYEFEEGDEIRWLRNCKHIFHRSCIDRWMDQERDTCPLCRNPFVPAEMREEFEKRLWDGLLVGDGDYDDFLLNCELVSVPLL